MATPLQNRYMTALQGAGARGQATEDDYLRHLREFNPYDSYRTQAEGAFGDFKRDFGQNLSDLRGQQVGMGRINTGFATGDEDRLFTDMGERLNDRLAQGSMQAASMDLSRMGQMGDYAQGTQNRYLSLLSGERDREIAEQEAKRQRKSSRWGALGSIAGGVLGTVLGPAGTAVGSKLGGWVGNKMGG